MQLDAWLLYLPMVLAVAILPGPSSLLAINHGLHHGARLVLPTAAGNALGVLLICFVAAAGLAAASTVSEEFLRGLRFAAGCFLLLLGLGVISTNRAPADGTGGADLPRFGLFLQGLLVGSTNPVIFSFSASVFPLFIGTNLQSVSPQLVVLSVTFSVLSFVCLVAYGFFADTLRRVCRDKCLRIAGLTKSVVYSSAGLYVAMIAFEG